MKFLIIGALLFCIHLLLSFLTYYDAESRASRRPMLFAFPVLVFGFLGFGCWMLYRGKMSVQTESVRKITVTRPSLPQKQPVH